jgi:hypothetical protein
LFFDAKDGMKSFGSLLLKELLDVGYERCVENVLRVRPPFLRALARQNGKV